ncbi:MAG: XdhC family protein [Acidimicrobiales bacterium]|nr:XdhC family protein [Acidimicrobiales bacterium]HBL07647.1 XshC-Cox1 family protein [Acidimicrobiaceae bacterium]
MREILGDLGRWRKQGRSVALARVIELDGSGPRLPGAAMAVTGESEVAGSVSGGCVEGAVVGEALEVLATGEGRMVTFGYSDDEALAVGLTCGGTIHLFIESLDEAGSGMVEKLTDLLADDSPCALATVVDGPGVGAKMLVLPEHADGETVVGTLGDAGLDRVAARDARGELAAGRSGVRHYGRHGEAREETVQVFVESYAPPPRMLVFGAVDFTAALVRVAKVLGYRVTVCDAREVFATRQRFPLADEVVVDWPDRLLDKVGSGLGPRDAVCVLTHDNKFDVPAIVSALATDVGYIGVMGSRRTHESRLVRLREAGVDDAGLARLRSPIGLDIGARTPEETAISILSEMITLRTGRSSRALSASAGPIHGPDRA